jgi:hypothetical protein
VNDINSYAFDMSQAYLYSIPSAVFAALQIIGSWLAFSKAGRPGWAAIVPFYNAYTYNKVGDKPGWWWVLWLIPIVNLVITLIVAIGIAKNFGKSTGFAVGLLWFLPWIGYPILGFGKATYKGAPPATA